MKTTKRNTYLLVAALLAATTGFGYGQEKTEPAKPKEKPTKVSAEDLKLATLSGIPSPVALFKAFDQLQGMDWKATAERIAKEESLERTSYKSDAVKALNIGTRIADAFFAIQAKDEKLLKDAAGTAIELSASFGMKEDLAPEKEKVTSLADKNEWNQVAQATQDVSELVKKKLKERSKEGEATLASVGGWLRGLQLVSEKLAANYSEQGGKMLRQGELIASMREGLSKAGGDPVVAKINAQIGEIEKLTSVAKGAAVSQENVKKLHQISTDLVNSIQEG